MNKTDKLNIMKQRIKRLEGTDKNIKCPGVLRGLRREVKIFEDSIFVDNGI